VLSKSASRYALQLASVLLIAAGVGALLDHSLVAIALAATVMLAKQVYNLIRLDKWLKFRSSERPPDLPGLWSDVLDSTLRLYRRKLFHKRRVQELLREFRRMSSAMPDGAILLGESREILWFNKTAGEWLSLRRKVDQGIRIENLVRVPAFLDYLETGGMGSTPRVQLPQRGDRWFVFNLVKSTPPGLQLLIVRDVTSEARLESMRKDFVANASHELRSPLTVISGYLDSLADENRLDPAWQEPVAEMRRQAERMRRIVQDLLELSRMEASGNDAGRESVNVAGMLSLMRKEVLSRPDRPAAFNLHLESDAHLLANESELHSIFSNLINNAVKYTPADGAVDIRWWTDEQGGHVSVADTGIGIPAEHLPRLTERFYRVDSGRSRKLGGSGLGLAIVKHALQRHGGRLEIQSVEGRGSTFTCHFPVERLQSVCHTEALTSANG